MPLDAGGSQATTTTSTSLYTRNQYYYPPAIPNTPTQDYQQVLLQQQYTAPVQNQPIGERATLGAQQVDVIPTTPVVSYTGANQLSQPYFQDPYSFTSQNVPGPYDYYMQFAPQGEQLFGSPTGFLTGGPALPQENITRQESQFTGREYYQGGSEQAYMGPIYQAQAAFGLLTPDEVSFLGVNNNLPSHLNPAQTRILTDNGVPPEVIQELYDYDEETGFWFRTSYADSPSLSGGYSGYSPYSYGYSGGRYAYPYSGGGGSYNSGGLINWRIGL